MDVNAYQFPPEPRDDLTVDTTWIDTVPPAGSPYWQAVRKAARALKSDGCTDVLDIYVESCYEHDIHWRTGRTIFGVPITTAQANRRFRKVIQSRDPLGSLSPLSWWRWVGVTVGGHLLKHRSK